MPTLADIASVLSPDSIGGLNKYVCNIGIFNMEFNGFRGSVARLNYSCTVGLQTFNRIYYD